MKKEFVAKNLQEAIDSAIDYFKVSESELEIEILEREHKGLLGIFGSKDARIIVQPKNDKNQDNIEEKEEVDQEVENLEEVKLSEDEIKTVAVDFLNKLFTEIGIDTDIVAEYRDNTLYIDVDSQNASLLIGKKSKNLDSIQYILSIKLKKYFNRYISVIVDCQGYKKRKEDSLISFAKYKADVAYKTRRDIILKPMSAYERKIVHCALQDDNRVYTKSEGNDDQRRVIIFPNRKR